MGGSPPHVRERQALHGLVAGQTGITPACAGKTTAPLSCRRNRRDHPRMCGKDPYAKPNSARHIGSPPHVRERRGLSDHSKSRAGITPACAGKTCIYLSGTGQREDHPRMCGKDSVAFSMRFTMTGSPPHVRERQDSRHDSWARYGITPACAGKTGNLASPYCIG